MNPISLPYTPAVPVIHLAPAANFTSSFSVLQHLGLGLGLGPAPYKSDVLFREEVAVVPRLRTKSSLPEFSSGSHGYLQLPAETVSGTAAQTPPPHALGDKMTLDPPQNSISIIAQLYLYE